GRGRRGDEERACVLIRRLSDPDEVLRIDAARLEVIGEEPGGIEDAVSEGPELLEAIGELRRVERLVEEQRQGFLERALDGATGLREVREQTDDIDGRALGRAHTARLH